MGFCGGWKQQVKCLDERNAAVEEGDDDFEMVDHVVEERPSRQHLEDLFFS